MTKLSDIHSDISVEQSLDITLRWCKENNQNLVIKPHPQNIESMKILEAIVKKHNYGIWMNNININTLLEKCLAVFTVNSGWIRRYITRKTYILLWKIRLCFCITK